MCHAKFNNISYPINFSKWLIKVSKNPLSTFFGIVKIYCVLPDTLWNIGPENFHIFSPVYPALIWRIFLKRNFKLKLLFLFLVFLLYRVLMVLCAKLGTIVQFWKICRLIYKKIHAHWKKYCSQKRSNGYLLDALPTEPQVFHERR